jgi:DNA-binding response OmpR family regulator
MFALSETMQPEQSRSRGGRLLVSKRAAAVLLLTGAVSLLCVPQNRATAALLLPSGVDEMSVVPPTGFSILDKEASRLDKQLRVGGEPESLLVNVFTMHFLWADEILPPALLMRQILTDGLPPVRNRFSIDLSRDSSDHKSSSMMPLSSTPSAMFLFGSGLIGILGILLRQESVRRPEANASDPRGNHVALPRSSLILLLSTDPEFSKEVEEPLRRSGYPIRSAPSVMGVLTLSRQTPPSLILVDRRVGDWSMLRTDSTLRHVPMIALVHAGSIYAEEDCLDDFERGMDGVHDLRDGYRLLVARVDAYLRRSGYGLCRRGVYQVGAIELDADIHEVKVGGRRVQLSAKPFAILEAFMRAPSKVLSRSELLDHVWGPGFAIGEHTLDVHVHALRRQLARHPDQLCQLVTIKGVGFKLKAVSPLRPAAQPITAGSTARIASTASYRIKGRLAISPSPSFTPQRAWLKRVPPRRARRLPSVASVRHLRNSAVVG